MPRLTVWIPQHQLDWAAKRFGADANMSGVCQAGLNCLKALAGGNETLAAAAQRQVDIVNEIEATRAAADARLDRALGEGRR